MSAVMKKLHNPCLNYLLTAQLPLGSQVRVLTELYGSCFQGLGERKKYTKGETGASETAGLLRSHKVFEPKSRLLDLKCSVNKPLN